MKVKFKEDYTTKEANPQSYKKDQVVDFPDDAAGTASAQHFINRGVAEDLSTDKDEPKVAKAQAQKLVPDPPEPFGTHGKKS